MIFKIEFEIKGNLNVSENNIIVKKYPFSIELNRKGVNFFISISKRIYLGSNCLPQFISDKIILPKEEVYVDMIEIIRHVESFGALDNKFESVDTSKLILRWIPEDEQDHFSPINEIVIQRSKCEDYSLITKNWLQDTIIHKNQLKDLYIPFAFYRDGKNLFQETRYQASFCSFYMMLEYFFHEKNWGIKDDAHKRKKCLNGSLTKTLALLKDYDNHYQWLLTELSKRHKQIDEAGLLFIINRFRDELSHAANKNKNRNVFNDISFFSLSFITMNICIYVSIKKRLLPFIQIADRESFLEK